MELIVILAACFTLLFVVEVFWGGTLPESEDGCSTARAPMKLGAFFGQALPLSAAGIGLPMSSQHGWAIWLVAGAAILHVLVCRIMRAC
ncbi:MAG: hypothetical protein ACLGSA_00935 [Acidobacteriota bacterium]